jgi:hypothetical protein
MVGYRSSLSLEVYSCYLPDDLPRKTTILASCNLCSYCPERTCWAGCWGKPSEKPRQKKYIPTKNCQSLTWPLVSPKVVTLTVRSAWFCFGSLMRGYVIQGGGSTTEDKSRLRSGWTDEGYAMVCTFFIRSYHFCASLADNWIPSSAWCPCHGGRGDKIPHDLVWSYFLATRMTSIHRS